MFGTITLFLTLVYTSNGDDQDDYKECLKRCEIEEQCDTNFFPANGQSLFNRLFLWDCYSECKYQCMWMVEKHNRQKGHGARQYYGKWPFTRLAGTQELFSGIFSFGNFVANHFGFHRIYAPSVRGKSTWFLHKVVVAHYLISSNGWLWSTIFHLRDCEFTMHMDYFSAVAIVFVSMILAIVRFFNIRSQIKQLLVALPIFIFYLFHVLYMLWIKFDFGWNMTICLTAGAIYMGLFFIWGLWCMFVRKRQHAKYAVVACVAGLAAALLEVIDFPPIFDLFDAHSIWHAATIPIVPLWYCFYRKDALYDLGYKSDFFMKDMAIDSPTDYN